MSRMADATPPGECISLRAFFSPDFHVLPDQSSNKTQKLQVRFESNKDKGMVYKAGRANRTNRLQSASISVLLLDAHFPNLLCPVQIFHHVQR